MVPWSDHDYEHDQRDKQFKKRDYLLTTYHILDQIQRTLTVSVCE